MGDETRTSAQARIATSAPKLTYGKHKNSLLPLTGIHFLHSNALDATNDRGRLASSNAVVPVTAQHSADTGDSPLSDVEPVAAKYKLMVISPRTRRGPVLTIDKPNKRPHRLAAGVASDGYSKSLGEQDNAARSPKSRATSGRHRAIPAQKEAKPKSVGNLGGRLPLNELVLVPNLSHQEASDKLSKKERETLLEDPISSSAQQILDLIGSDDSDMTPTKRKANVPLSAIRKRLRTPSANYKPLQTLRRRYNASQITPTGGQLRQIVGDGFDHLELIPVPQSRYTTKHTRKHHEPLLPNFQTLSLATGPLPDVVFMSSSQLDLGNDQESPCDYSTQDPANIASASHGIDQLSFRGVEFKSAVDQCILAQLESVSAPRRERSVSLGCGSEDGDEGDDEGDDEEEVDTYVDGDELIPEEDDRALSEDHLETRDCSPNPSTERQSYARNRSHLFRAASTSDQRLSGKYPGFHHRRTPTGEPRLNEFNDLIEDDDNFDDMLLDNQRDLNDNVSQIDVESVRIIEAPHLNIRNHSDIERTSSRPRTQPKPPIGSLRTRSILKNSTLHVSSESNRPESTAANTQRNSTIEVEQSRYFNAAKDRLDTSLRQPVVIRRKSGSRCYPLIQVPFSDDMVPETSPKQVDYTDTRQLHTLKRTREAPVPETDLKSLTRSMSRINGTLSQSVTRRSGMPFQNLSSGC